MKKSTCILFGLIALSAIELANAQDVIQVVAGRQRVLELPYYGTQINIADPTIAIGQRLPNQRQIIITGCSAGTTTLTISGFGGNVIEKVIRVVQQDPKTVLNEIKEIFGGIESMEFSVKAGEVVASGAIYTEADLEKFNAIKKRYPQIIDRVVDKSEKLMISVTVEVIELIRTKGTELGKGDLPLSSALFNSATGLKPFWSFGVSDDIVNRIALWKTSGLGKVIANPTLAVINSDTAVFLAGGEIPIAYNAGLGNLALEYKEYGVRLKVCPRLTGSGKILLAIMAEVSNIDLAVQNRQTGAPGLLSRRVSSTGMVEEGKSILLAGIYQTLVTKNRKRIPLLGHLLPFIFSSVAHREEKKELVVLVTPKTPVSSDLQDYPMITKELQKKKKGK
jgi:pilus assembly protein CpaC